jgi:hypothetical protein
MYATTSSSTLSNPQTFNFFPFSWHYADEKVNNKQKCVITIFGWNEKNESVCVKVKDFSIPVWVELPSDEEWTQGKRSTVANYLKEYTKYDNSRPVSIKYQLKKKLYNAKSEELFDQKKTLTPPPHPSFTPSTPTISCLESRQPWGEYG